MNEASRLREDEGLVGAYVELILGGVDEAEIGALWDELVRAKGREFAGRVEAAVMRRDALLQEQTSNKTAAASGSARPSARGEPETTEAVPGAAQSTPAQGPEEAMARAEAPPVEVQEALKRGRRDEKPEPEVAAAERLVLSKMSPDKTAELFIRRKCMDPDGVPVLRYVHDDAARGTFHCWDGKVWRKESEVLIGKRVTEFFGEAWTRTEEGGWKRFQFKRDEVGQVLHFLSQRLVAPADMVAPAWLRPDGTFEAAGDWLVCTNGMVNVRTGETRAHTPELFTTNSVKWASDPEAMCPEWLKFLGEVFPGDDETSGMVEEWLGYNMTSDVSFQKGMNFGGKSRSGKGTIIKVLMELVGDKAYTGQDLISFGRGDFSKEGLLGKKAIVFADERQKEARGTGKWYDPGGVGPVAQSLLLKVTGADADEVKRKYMGPVTVQLPGKATILSNKVINYNDKTLADRFMVAYFGRNFEEEGLIDHELFEKRLRPELSGIAVRALAGYQRLCRRGKFVQPKSGEAWRAALAAKASPTFEAAAQLLFVPDAAGWVSKTEARAVFDEWCDENNPKLKHQCAGNIFIRWLRKQPGFEAIESDPDKRKSIDGKSVHVYLGFRLREGA
jgi:putative DNA primase/helicase